MNRDAKGTQAVVATFSIAAYDPEAEEWGIAVQSKFLAVGSVVPWLKAGAGAVATQSYANTSYGPEGLKLLESGMSAEEVVKRLTDADEDRDLRQVGIVDKSGAAATFTGKDCFEWAGGRIGNHYAAQGNILVNEETVNAMAETFERVDGSLASRLLAALEAGQLAGGDRRGRQSAALAVVREGGGYGGFNDRVVDLRVDDHEKPIKELARIYQLHELYFSETKPENVAEIEGDLREEMEGELVRLNYLAPGEASDDDRFYEALTSFLHTENFEEREQPQGKVDLAVVAFMKGLSPR
ncbi:MAG TPA: DUF1028 domain-containing protein [Bacillales bacterium]|nr:DUF1028 domain-containing protein [Bacillales bacterium]